MTETLEFVVRYGYALLFVWVLVEQAGLPIPAIPLLLASGALAAQGRMHLALAMLIPAFASLCSDSFWYFFGKRRGADAFWNGGRGFSALCPLRFPGSAP